MESFNIKELFNSRARENMSLHSQYINPQFAKVLSTIGFDKCYVRAEGASLFDADGNEYIDFLSGYGVFGLGRNHPKIKKILHEFIDMDTANLIQMEAPILSGILAEALIKRVNQRELDTVYFTNSGTEANETAIKFARAATGRQRFLFLDHAFHGLSTGSLALNGGPHFREGFGDLLPGCTKIEMNNLSQLEEELKKKDVAAFFFEPIQGKGVYLPNDDYLPKAQELCRKYGTLFIADEVQSGLGRTGKWFAYEHWNLSPDVICIAKALSAGFLPIGAVITKRSIYDKVFSRMDRCVVHSSTFGQNNMAMVCGLAALHLIEEEKLVENAAKMGDLFLSRLKEIAARHEWVADVRGKGLMIGIEFGSPKGLANKMRWNLVHKIDKGLFGELIVMPLMVKHRMLTQVTGHHQDIIKLIPPLTINESHIDKFCAAFESVLSDCDKISGPIWEMGKNILKQAMSNKQAQVS